LATPPWTTARLLQWRKAADAVRAASDLLSTYRAPSGKARAPEAELLDDVAIRAAGFGELASLAIPVAMAANALGRRLEETGMDPDAVDRVVPETKHLREAAFASRRLARLGGIGGPLADLEVARPSVRTQDPVIELEDRIARMHRVSHQLVNEEWVGVCSMADIAVAGIVVNESAARVMRAAAAADPEQTPDLSKRRAVARFEEGAAAWREVHSQLRILRTTTPALPGLRGDAFAVRELCEQLADGEAARAVMDVLVGGARRLSEVAPWNYWALQNQGVKGRLLVPGRHLTGDQVSDEPLLVRAKLRGLLAPALKEHMENLSGAYARVAAAGRVRAEGSPGPEPARISGPTLEGL
jgi:hypothetical protein